MKTKTETQKKVTETQKSIIKDLKFVRDSPISGMTTLYICGIDVMSVNIDDGEYIAIIPFRGIDVGLGLYQKTKQYGIVRDRLQFIVWVGDIISNLQKIRNQLTSFYGEI